MVEHNRVVIELGEKKAFASAIDWPGWSRPAKSEDAALDALSQYADRYRRVADLVKARGVRDAAESLQVIELVAGNAITDFGVPVAIAACENEAMALDDCERQIDLLRACWMAFDAAAARVSEELRKGPRGGGRDRTKLVAHVFEAERGYARKIDVSTPPRSLSTDGGLQEHRESVCNAIRAANADAEIETRWPVRYFIRRAAWHVLDHAWEMEDKDLSGDAAAHRSLYTAGKS
jgi:hypothetical protein